MEAENPTTTPPQPDQEAASVPSPATPIELDGKSIDQTIPDSPAGILDVPAPSPESPGEPILSVKFPDGTEILTAPARYFLVAAISAEGRMGVYAMPDIPIALAALAARGIERKVDQIIASVQEQERAAALDAEKRRVSPASRLQLELIERRRAKERRT